MFGTNNGNATLADKARKLAKTGMTIAAVKKLTDGNNGRNNKKTGQSDLRLAAGAFVGGALAMYLLDPHQGRRRRHLAVDRTAGAVRSVGRKVGRRGRYTAGRVTGAAGHLTHSRDGGADYNDPTLAHKIESEVLRRPAVDAGRININVERGVAVLRGTVDRPRDIRKLERKVAAVPGVRGVKNLLHLENTPAPH